MRGRLFWKILLLLWLTFVLIAQLVWVVFSVYGDRHEPPEMRAARYVASLQLDTAAQALKLGGVPAFETTVNGWAAGERNYFTLTSLHGQEAPAKPKNGDDWKSFLDIRPEASRLDQLSRLVVRDDGERYQVTFNAMGWLDEFRGDMAPNGSWFHLPPPLLWLGSIGGLIFSLLLAWNLTRPLSQLRGGFNRVARGDLSVRLLPVMRRRHDELSAVAHDFDAMVERLDVLVSAREQLLHDVSHELRSPLARLQLAIGLASQNSENVANSLQRIEREAERMDKMIGELLALARSENAASAEEYFDLLGLVSAVVNDARYEAQVPGVNIALSAGDYDDYTVKGSAEMMRRALENIVRNALRFSRLGQQVSVTLARNDCEWIIGVSDQGPGVEKSKLSSIFDPFMRIDSPQSGKGYGLGLAIARKAVLAHGGRIEAENRGQGGLLIRICVPRWQ